MKQPKLSDIVEKMGKYNNDGPAQKKYDNLVLELLSMNFLPFRLLDSPEWKALILFLDKRINLKDRTTYSRQVKKVSDEVQEKVKDIIKKECGASLAVTSDLWSSRILESYISGTFHFYDSSFRLHRYLIIF